MKIETQFIHGGIDGDERTGAASVPIYQTSTYKFKNFKEHRGYDYSRAGNPTREALEKLMAELEEGHASFAFSSGMAAMTAVLTLFKSGEKLLISDNIYGGTYRVLDKIFNRFNLYYEIVNTNDLNALENKIDENVKGIIIESPTNPLLGITNIAAVSQLAQSKGILTIVDNTFMSPYLQMPITLGADIVVHSGTKYLGGHSDLIAGLVVTANEILSEAIYFIQKSTGGVLSPSDSWLLMRGIKTLGVRMDRHLENAEKIAVYLQAHEGVERAYYPGFTSHRGHEIHKKQAKGFGGLISFVLKSDYDIEKFVESLSTIMFGESLGGVESIMTHPASMTHGAIPYEVRQEMGIVDELLRLSVGIEHVDDLIEDLEGAFLAAKKE